MAEKKTAAQKAQEALDVATRKRDRTKDRLDKAEAEVADAKGLLEIQEAEVAYLAQHPALTQQVKTEADETPSAPAPREMEKDPLADF